MTLCQGDVKRAALAAVAQFTMIGVPMIYYGDEVGLSGGNDPGCRGCMPWQEQEWNRDLRALYRRLARIRMVYPALRSASLTPLMTFNGVYAFVRSSNVEDVIVVLNPRQARRDMVIPVPEQIATASVWRDVLSGDIITRDSSGLWIERLPEKTALLLVPEINREAVTHGTN
jgi:glycosidase